MNGKDKQKLTVTPEFLAGRGYSLSKAARAVDVSVTHLIKVCKGERKPSAALLTRIEALPAYHPVKCRVEY